VGPVVSRAVVKHVPLECSQSEAHNEIVPAADVFFLTSHDTFADLLLTQ
jgi:hypothetical protein